MILQVSRLNPSVLMSVPVKKQQHRKSSLQPLLFNKFNLSKLWLTFADNLVHDGPQFACRDLLVLKRKAVSQQGINTLPVSLKHLPCR